MTMYWHKSSIVIRTKWGNFLLEKGNNTATVYNQNGFVVTSCIDEASCIRALNILLSDVQRGRIESIPAYIYMS
jgi:hypothetical protein